MNENLRYVVRRYTVTGERGRGRERERERERVDGDGWGHFSPSLSPSSSSRAALFLSAMDGRREGGRGNE